MIIKKYQVYFLSLILGLVYLFSAVSKIYPIELLEFSIVEFGFFNWISAAFIARTIISLEFIIGLLLVFNVKTKFALKASLSFLLGFTFYLIYLLIIEGNRSNCNCFGAVLVLTPLESIAKNILLIFINLWALFKAKSKFSKIHNYLLIAFTLASFTSIFIAIPIRSSNNQVYNLEKGEILNLEKIFNDPELDNPSEKIYEGKWLIFFASSNCKHCIVGAYKVNVLLNKFNQFNAFFFINGDDDEISDFHKLTKTHDIPYMKLPAAPMIFYSKGKLPAIFLINNQVIEFKPNYIQLDENLISKWLLEK